MKMWMKFLLALVVFMVSGCAAVQPSSQMAPLVGDVINVGQGTVLYGIRAALAGQPGCDIYRNGSNFLVVWTYQNTGAAGFFSVTIDGVMLDTKHLLSGNLAASTTVSDLIASLKNSGWEKVAPTSAPAIFSYLANLRVPVVILATGVFPGGFENWFNDTFYPKEEQL